MSLVFGIIVFPQALTTKDAIENLAARYTFRFIGDSTTRRLTESFMSIVTGEGSTHPKVQTRIDFSTGDLKVCMYEKGGRVASGLHRGGKRQFLRVCKKTTRHSCRPQCRPQCVRPECVQTCLGNPASPCPAYTNRNSTTVPVATSLQVVFDWAPFCSGPLSVGEMLTTVIAEESAEKQGEGNYKRPIIITAFGIHDASYQLQVSQNNIKDWYRDQMPQEIFKQDGFRAAGLAACREATAQFVRAATGLISAAGVKAGGDSPLSPEDEEDSEKEEEEEEGEGRGHDRGRRTRSRERRLQQRRESVAETVPGGVGRGDASQNNISISNNTEAEVSIAGGLGPPPLVFVLQNNGYNDHDDFQQMFLEEVRLIQRQEIGIGLFETLGETKIVNVDDEGAGVFLVDDSVSLYGKLACYRIEPSSHYHEPVKIVEGKVLWDLVALADRESGPALPTHGGSSDVNSSGRVGPAVVLAAGRWTAVVLILVGWLW